MKQLPVNFENSTAQVLRQVTNVEGQLTPKEIRLLFLLATVPTTTGEILEIGSFKGKSTIVLAKGAELTSSPRVVAVDPLTSPSITDPHLGGKASGWDDFQANLKRAGVEKNVEFHQQFSSELAKAWDKNRKIRLLWIDGDHTHAGTKTDFDLFSPFLADGAIVAFHDVLHHHGGPARVFAEGVLLSQNFGPAGVCGSIGWSQYFKDAKRCQPHLAAKIRLYRRLSSLIGYVAFGGNIEGLAKIHYKLIRFSIPHGEVNPQNWLNRVEFHTTDRNRDAADQA